MIGDFLVKKLVKDYENISNPDVRENYGVLVSGVGVLLNALLFIIKLAIGFIINSVSVMADSFNNLSDATSSIISLIGFKMANKPPDKEHPFGHGRTESITAFIISIIILLLGFEFLKTSIDKIFNPVSVGFSFITLGFLIFTIIVKVWMAIFNRKLGKKLDSQVMMATSQDSINDVLITSVTVVSLIVSNYTDFIIDGYAGVFVALALLFTGYQIAKEVISSLLGEAPDSDLVSGIEEKVNSYEDIVCSYDLIIHNYGQNKAMATIRVELSDELSLVEAHRIVDIIEKDILREFDIDLLIHIEPIDISDKILIDITNNVTNNIDSKLDAHNFTMEKNNGEKEIRLELSVPHDYTDEEIENAKKYIIEMIWDIKPDIKCDIHVENPYT